MDPNGSAGRTPISLEELLARRRHQIEESQRPRFLSKAERERLVQEKNAELARQAAVPVASRLDETKRRLFSEKTGSEMDVDGEAGNAVALERSLLREKFLGIKDESRSMRPRRFVEKKFNFDWDANEDTSTARLDALILGRARGGNEEESTSISKRRRFDDRHWTEKTLAEMEDRDWRIFREDYSISTSGGSIPNPIRYWNESSLPSELLATLHRTGFLEPTPIQRQAIPLALGGRDFIGVAETGSGKTASFVLPMIAEIMRLPKMTPEIAAEGPYGLVLAPTRELANQIEAETRKFLAPLGCRCFSIVGGHSMDEQAFSLRNGAEIIIATPGRLRDCIDQHVLVLNQCKYVVLDEADRMIDLNFEDDLNFILGSVPRHCSMNINAPTSPHKYPLHITMYSATMPLAVERLARQYLLRPATVAIGQAGMVADTIEQRLEMVGEDDKSHRIVELLSSEADERFPPPIIVFVNQKKTVDYLSKRLETVGLRVIALHGGKGQDQREAAINLLKTGQKDVLVATDVAGRGIDIKNVSLVINYDMAKSTEDYIHRVGRTGRAGSLGTAITFLTQGDSDVFYDLRVLLQKSKKSIIPSEFLQHEASQGRQRPGDRMIE